MYKKILYIMLTIVTLLSLGACGSSASDKEPTKTPTATEAPKDSEEEEKKDLSSVFDELKNRLNVENDEETSKEVSENQQEDAVRDNQNNNGNGVIVNNEQCAFTIVSVEKDSFFGYTLNVQLENKTDTELCFSIDDSYVNGVYCDPYWYQYADAGKTVTDEITFYADDLEALHITDVTSILFLLTVYDNDDWSVENNFVEDFFVFYPNGEENAVAYQYDLDSDDTVLLDNEDFLVVVTDYENDEDWGFIVNLYLENKTSNHFIYSLEDVSVNGFMCDPYWSFSLPAGMKAHSAFYFSPEDLADSEIDDVTAIEFLLEIYDYNSWDTYSADSFTLYPAGEDAAQEAIRTPKDTDIVLFDNDTCTMIVTGFEEDEFWGYTMTAYLENKTDKNLYFTADDVKVNGVDCDPFWMELLAPEKKCYAQISWSTYQFEDNDITTVESIEFPVSVSDYDNWFGDIFVEETFTITP